MTGLPQALTVGGQKLPIDADFRNVLRIFQAFNDPDLTDREKAFICVQRLYRKAPGSEHWMEAIERAYWFCGGGDIPQEKPARVKLLDWEQDAGILFPAINKTLGFEVRAVKFLHWWTFLGAFCEIGEGTFSTVLHIRRKLADRKPLDKWEREILKQHRAMIVLRSEQERKAIDETETFLKTLI